VKGSNSLEWLGVAIWQKKRKISSTTDVSKHCGNHHIHLIWVSVTYSSLIYSKQFHEDKISESWIHDSLKVMKVAPLEDYEHKVQKLIDPCQLVTLNNNIFFPRIKFSEPGSVFITDSEYVIRIYSPGLVFSQFEF